MLVLEERLLAAARFVQGPVVADIGTDHALLPRYLLQRGLAERVITVEKSRGPQEVALANLRGYSAEVRRGDGFEVLTAGEVDCAALCGMGGGLIRSILSRWPERLPGRLVLQANRDTSLLRRWAGEYGYHLVQETIAAGFWNYPVLALQRGEGPDPAYQGIEQELAFEFGPHLLRQRHPLLLEELSARERYFRDSRALAVYRRIERALDYLNCSRR